MTHDHHHHGHEHDQGLSGLIRYLRFLPSMWRSDVNDAVVTELALLPGESVVDIGAGMGAGVVPAAATGAEVIAVDPTNYMRAVIGLRRTWQRARKRIRVEAGTAERLPLEDDRVDAIMAVNAIHHWHDVGAAASEMARVLRSGGRAVLVDEQFRDPAHPDYDEFDEEHEHMFDEAELDEVVAALTEAGLDHVVGERTTMLDLPVLRFRAEKR